MKSCIFFLWCILLFKNTVAQQPIYFLQNHINSENGLPQNTVRDIAFSPSGYMWMATENGLVRFDGKRTKNFFTSNSGLTRNRISQLILMNDGKLYCITEESLLFQIIETTQAVQIIFIKKLNKISPAVFHFFKSDSLSSFIKTCKLITTENVSNNYQSSIFILDKERKIFQRTKMGLLVYSNTYELIDSFHIPNVTNLDFFIAADALYAKSDLNQFYRVNTNNGKLTTLKIIGADVVNGVSLTKAQNDGKLLWNYKTMNSFFINKNTCYDIQIENETIFLHKRIELLPDYQIETISYSPNHENILVGTLSNGVYVYNKKKFSVVTSPYGANIYYAQAVKNDSAVIVSNPLQELSQQTNILYETGKKYYSNMLYYDKQHLLWCGFLDTLFSINLSTHKINTKIFVPNTKGVGIGFIAQRDSNSIYISSNTSLYYYGISNELVKLLDYNNAGEIKRAYCVLQDGDSLLYIGTNAGIYKYSIKTNRSVLLGLNNVNVRAIFKTAAGILLAGTYGNGIYIVQKNKCVPLPLDKNENLKTTHAFVEDNSGFIWMSSNNGLYKIATHEIEAFAKDSSLLNLYYYRYSTIDGLLTNEFNGGCFPNVVQVNSSTWSLPSMQGLVWFQPDSLNDSIQTGGIFIDRIVLNDSNVVLNTANSISTFSHQFKLSVFINSPNWSDENNLQIEYKIDDLSWVLLKDNAAPIVFQNLSGGAHILKIRKRFGFGINDFKEINFTIKVPKLLHEYTWFWPVTILLSLLLMYGLIKISNYAISQRKKNLEVLVKEKTIALHQTVEQLKITNTEIEASKEVLKKESLLKSNLLFLLSHDIATPLRFVNRYLASVTSADATYPKKEDLMDLKISTQNLESLLDNIVTWIKQTENKEINIYIEPIKLKSLVAEKIELFSLAAKKKQNEIVNAIVDETIIYSDKFIISMAIQNLLGNAINYTKNGTIEISFVEEATGKEILVKDNGVGMKPRFNTSSMDKNPALDHSLLGYGIGLKITTELLVLIGGKIIFNTPENSKGTTAIIYLEK